ncbi:uncharacterized protein LOC116986580 [Amblyraja radiata]|uniref:uncharacterized protein LOC116986580 n=1 Tax=Amblyraja radiata TaxID=386614 RepID=UPI0014030029|nr:uncharacterized protein LOC116986580 [Amblyraja radiata]
MYRQKCEFMRGAAATSSARSFKDTGSLVRWLLPGSSGRGDKQQGLATGAATCRFSRACSGLDSFSEHCGLEPEVIENLAREKFAADAAFESLASSFAALGMQEGMRAGKVQKEVEPPSPLLLLCGARHSLGQRRWWGTMDCRGGCEGPAGGSEEESVPDLFTLIINLAALEHHFKMFSLRRIPFLLCASLIGICVAGTGAAAGTVTGARGHSVSLPAGITVAPDIARIEWSRTSPRTKITTYSAENIEYYTTNYKGRVTLHRGNFSLEIHDLWRDDAGDYQVDVVTSSGSETQARVRLEVYEPVAGTQIKIQYITGICNLTCSVTSGDPTSFRWWRGQEPLGNDSTHHPRRHGETIEVHHTAAVGDIVYKCEARNLVSEGTAQILLPDVCKQAPPEPVSGTQIKAENITEICDFTLTCYVTSGDSTSFTWWREAVGNDSTHHLEGHGKTIQVHHTAEVGDVVYRCEARNLVSEGTAQIRLKNVCKQTTSGLSSCLCGCWLRATVAAVLLLILISVTVATHIISARPVSGTAERPHKTE